MMTRMPAAMAERAKERPAVERNAHAAQPNDSAGEQRHENEMEGFQ